jgi:hypothetical protein
MHLELHQFDYDLNLLSIKLIEEPSGKVYSYYKVKKVDDIRDRFLTLYIFLQRYLLYFENSYYSLTDKIIIVRTDLKLDERLILSLNSKVWHYNPWAETTPLRRAKFVILTPIAAGPG